MAEKEEFKHTPALEYCEKGIMFVNDEKLMNFLEL